MTQKKKIQGWLGVALLALAVGSPAAVAKSVGLDVQMSQPIVLAGSPQRAYLRVALTGIDTDSGRRAPVNVAIVLDRSGSMSGQKIEEAKRAAIMAVEKLRDRRHRVGGDLPERRSTCWCRRPRPPIVRPSSPPSAAFRIGRKHRPVRRRQQGRAGAAQVPRPESGQHADPALRRSGQRRPQLAGRAGPARRVAGARGRGRDHDRSRAALQRGPDDPAGPGQRR